MREVRCKQNLFFLYDLPGEESRSDELSAQDAARQVGAVSKPIIKAALAACANCSTSRALPKDEIKEGMKAFQLLRSFVVEPYPVAPAIRIAPKTAMVWTDLTTVEVLHYCLVHPTLTSVPK